MRNNIELFAESPEPDEDELIELLCHEIAERQATAKAEKEETQRQEFCPTFANVYCKTNSPNSNIMLPDIMKLHRMHEHLH